MLHHRAQSRFLTARRVVALAAAAVLTIGGTAVADDISNDIDGSIDAVAEQMALNAGGGSGSTTLYVQPRNGDSKNGCNFGDGGADGTLTINLTSSNPTVATVSPATATFDSCGDTSTVTITPVATGTADISAALASNSTTGSFNLAPVKFTVTVNPSSNTAPSVSIDGVSAGGSYPKGSVPAATCVVTDAEDGATSFPATLTSSLNEDDLGTQTASCTYTDDGGLEVSASKTYSIVDPSAPVITYTLSPTSADGGGGWYRGTVTLTWHVSEPESPSSLLLTGCDNRSISADQNATTYSCSATSSGGASGPQSVTIKRDGNGPVVTHDSSQPGAPNGDNSWYTTPVTATFAAEDAYSGMAPGSESATATSAGDGEAVTIDSPAFTDVAGNTTDQGAVTAGPFKIDTVAPTVDAAVLTGSTGSNGWYTSAVTASFLGHDDTSGVAGDNPKTVSTGLTQGETTLMSPAFSDVAGNTTAAGEKSAKVKVDSIAPTVALVSGPAAGESYYFGSVPAAPTCSASDYTSGIDGDCTVTGYGAGVGEHTVTATVKDLAGNTSTVTRTYTVKAWTTYGFYKPVDMGGVFNRVKGGSTVPLKFELFAGPTELTDTSVVESFNAKMISCDSSADVDDLEFVTTGGTSLRYDTTAGQFVQNWKVPTQTGCYRAIMTADDGSTISALFRVIK
jgi:hypothetical protein